MDKKELKAAKQAQMVDLIKSTVQPLVTSPLAQILMGSVLVEYLQRYNVHFNGSVPAGVAATSTDSTGYFAPLISDSLGTSIEVFLLAAGTLNTLAKSDVIEQLVTQGSAVTKNTSGVIRDVLPLLLTAGAI